MLKNYNATIFAIVLTLANVSVRFLAVVCRTRRQSWRATWRCRWCWHHATSTWCRRPHAARASSARARSPSPRASTATTRCQAPRCASCANPATALLASPPTLSGSTAPSANSSRYFLAPRVQTILTFSVRSFCLGASSWCQNARIETTKLCLVEETQKFQCWIKS